MTVCLTDGERFSYYARAFKALAVACRELDYGFTDIKYITKDLKIIFKKISELKEILKKISEPKKVSGTNLEKSLSSKNILK